MTVTLYTRGSGEKWGRIWSGPLRTFVDDNTMGEEEYDEIVAALHETGEYVRGGGAAGEWMVKAPKPAREENARRTKEQISSGRAALVAYVEKHPGVEARDIMHSHPSSEVRMRGEAGIRSDLNALVEDGAIEKRMTTRSKAIERGTFAGTGMVTTSVAEYWPTGTTAAAERRTEEMKARMRAKRGPKPKRMPKRKRNTAADSGLVGRLRF